MKPFTWRGIDCLMVAPILVSRCNGCLFSRTPDDECPHTDTEADVICDVNNDVNNDVIFIEDTEDAMAAYVAKKLEGT